MGAVGRLGRRPRGRGRPFVDKVGAGTFAGLTITANILVSLLIDQFGMFGIGHHAIGLWRIVGAVLMVGGITLIAIF